MTWTPALGNSVTITRRDGTYAIYRYDDGALVSIVSSSQRRVSNSLCLRVGEQLFESIVGRQGKCGITSSGTDGGVCFLDRAKAESVRA